MEQKINIAEIIEELHALGGVKFGDFKLKSGKLSPVYFDLRVIISKPKLLEQVSKLIWDTSPNSCKADLLCGVPYTALPLATLMSVEHDKPTIIRRKEVKQYGTGKILEGDFKIGDKCLIVEDVITSGSSVLETATILRQHGLVVEEALVFLDREQGSKDNLMRHGITAHTVTNVTNILNYLKESGKICTEVCQKVTNFTNNNQILISDNQDEQKKQKLPYEKRMELSTCGVIQKLLDTMLQKETNLCVAVDVQNFVELVSIAEKIGPYICCLKTHVDMLKDWSTDMGSKLRRLADKHNFLLFEDRKFSDIGNTVSMQYHGGPFQVSSWSDLITVHALAGPGVLLGLQNPVKDDTFSNDRARGALIVAEMSSSDNLLSHEYTRKCVEMFNKYSDRNLEVPPIGFVAQSMIMEGSNFIQMMPGVSLKSKSDSLGQNYVSVEDAILKRGADIIIVGRGITSCNNDVVMIQNAKEYQKLGWNSYLKRCAQN